MGIAESMKGLTEDIIVSFDARVKALSDLVADTRKTLKGFASNRKQMATEQAESLSNFVKDLAKNVSSLLKEFDKNHEKMGEEQTKNLIDFVKNLTKEVGSLMNGFCKERKEMSVELKDKLAKEVKEIETHVKRKLKEFSDAHADMSEELKKALAKYVGDIVSSVKSLLREYNSDMVQARSAWQGMATTLAKAKRKGVMPRIEAGEKVATVEEAVARKIKGKKRGKKAKRERK